MHDSRKVIETTDPADYADRAREHDEYAWVPRPGGLAVLVGLFALMGTLHVLAVLGTTALAFLGNTGTLNVGGIDLSGPFGGFLAGSAILVMVLGVLNLICARVLWSLHTWAWGLALTLAIVNILIFPHGTVLGILAIVYLGMYDVREMFKKGSPARRATPLRGRAI